MNVADIIERVNRIAAMSGDDEAAHSEEDKLYEEVLQAIVRGGNEDPPERLAAAVLQTKNLDFERWCA